MSSNSDVPGLLTGLTYTVPIAGVIRSGYIVSRQGKRLPCRDDEFSITLKHKEPDGTWATHPLDATLREQHGTPLPNNDKKLRRIPVVIGFDNPMLSLSEQFAVFNRDGRPMCVGNGCKAKRRDIATGATAEVPCPGPDGCDYGEQNRCDALARLVLQIEGQEHEGAYFIFRTGSINAVTDLRTSLEMLKKLFGGLAGLKMWLTLEPKSSSQSMGTTFWYASLRLREGNFAKAAQALAAHRTAEKDAGLDRAEFESMLLTLRDNGTFAETREDAEQFEDLVEARFADGAAGEHVVRVAIPSASADIADLTSRLVAQAAAGGTAGDAAGDTGADVAAKPPAAAPAAAAA
ncbi:MAG: hypothetical protein HYX47_12915 [Burkholderiales bacterium]|nr:hypothetical protein [Burkholderiales bacterium]